MGCGGGRGSLRNLEIGKSKDCLQGDGVERISPSLPAPL